MQKGGRGFNSGYMCHNLREGGSAVYKIKLPRAGAFDVKFKYYDKNGGIYDMYILPVENDQTYESAAAEVSAVNDLLKTPVVTGIDHTTRESSIKTARGSYTAAASGEYYLVFKATTGGYLRGAELILSLVTKLDTVMTSLSETELLVGEYAVASFSSKDNTGKDFDTATSTVTYKSSDKSVATIDGKTGVIYAVGAGETEITVKVDEHQLPTGIYPYW